MSMQNTVETVQKTPSLWRRRIGKEWDRRKEQPLLLLMDAAQFLLAFLFSKTHVLFGAYPLGIAIVGAMSSRLWLLLPGVMLGALSLGMRGVVYVLTAAITVLLRAALSGTGRTETARTHALFGERPALRASSAVMGGCICSVYELLLVGFSLTSVLYGATMIVLTGGITLLFSGVEQLDMTTRQLLLGGTRLPSADAEGGRRRALTVRLSLLAFCLFVPLSLSELSLLGISAGYLAAATLTLFAARRFGLISGGAVGFVAAIGLSTVSAVSYALGGLAAAMLTPLGIGVALIGATVAVGAWSSLSAGLVGFVTALPEFALAAVLFVPLAKRMAELPSAPSSRADVQRAADMVGTMAMSYRAQAAAPFELEQAIASLTPLLRALRQARCLPDEQTVRRLLTEAAEAVDREGFPSCRLADGTREEHVRSLTARLADGQALTQTMLVALVDEEEKRGRLLEEYELRLRAWYADRHCAQSEADAAVLCELFAKMLAEVRERDAREYAPNAALTQALEEVFVRHGFADGVIRAYGRRRIYVLAAAEDVSGSRISAPQLQKDLETVAGVSFGKPTFFRKDAMVLMECRSTCRYLVKTGVASAARRASEVSGDTVRCFAGADETQYVVLSDGMGTGEEAHRASAFAAEYLSRLMGTGCTEGTALYLLNRLLRDGGEECSTTVDLFSFDLIRAEGCFCKCGAAASYLKRGESLYRVRSQTAPLGLMQTLDAERIRVDVQAEDILIMFSDGISLSPEEDPWLVELLSRPAREDLDAYAALILREAQKHARHEDDRTVLVARIVAA